MDVFPARQHGLASGLPCKAAPYLFRGSDGVCAVFRQLDGCAHAPACLRDGRRPASAAVRDVPDCTRAFRRDACKRNSAVRYRGLVHLPGRLSNGAVKIRRTGRSSGFYVACRGKKCRRTVRGKAKALRNGNFSAGGWGGRYWAAARGRRQSSGPFQSGKCRRRCADGPSAFFTQKQKCTPIPDAKHPGHLSGAAVFLFKGRRAGIGASKDKVWPRPRC